MKIERTNVSKDKPKLTAEQLLDIQVKRAISFLNVFFGIDDLTNTEYLYLREIAKGSIANQQFSEDNRKELFSMNMVDPTYDTYRIFIQRMYGIPEFEIPKKFKISIDHGKETRSFDNKIEAEKKADELRKTHQAIEVYQSDEAVDAFKKYLKKMRESHEFDEQFSA